MIIVVLPDILIDIIANNTNIDDIIINQEKHKIEFISCMQIENDVKKSFQNDNQDAVRAKIFILNALLKRIKLFPEKVYKNYLQKTEYMKYQAILPYLALYHAKNADYLWTNEDISPLIKGIKSINTINIIKMIKGESFKVFTDEGGLDTSTDKSTGDETQRRFPNIPPAEIPPKPTIEEDEDLDNQECKFIFIDIIEDMEYTREDVTAFLNEVGIYSYCLNGAIYYEDLYLSNFSDIKYYEIETYQNKIEPYGKINRYSIDISGRNHLMDVYISEQGSYPFTTKLDKTLRFETGKSSKSNVPPENKPEIEDFSKLGLTFDLLFLDSKKYGLDPNTFKEHSKKIREETIFNELNQILEQDFGGILTPETLVEGAKLLVVKWKRNPPSAVEKGENVTDKLDVLQISQLWVSIMNALKKKDGS